MPSGGLEEIRVGTNVNNYNVSSNIYYRISVVLPGDLLTVDLLTSTGPWWEECFVPYFSSFVLALHKPPNIY